MEHGVLSVFPVIFYDVVYGDPGYLVLAGLDAVIPIGVNNIRYGSFFFHGEPVGGSFLAEFFYGLPYKFNNGVLIPWYRGVMVSVSLFAFVF
jgi:hypothetical protein